MVGVASRESSVSPTQVVGVGAPPGGGPASPLPRVSVIGVSSRLIAVSGGAVSRAVADPRVAT